MHVVCMFFDNIYCAFLDNMKIVYFKGIYYEKLKILSFGDQNWEISDIRDSHSAENLVLRHFVFFLLRVTSQLYILAAFKHLPFF